MHIFTLAKQSAVFKNLNLRKENHGDDEKILACDINLELIVGADVLQKLAMNDEAGIPWDALLWDEKGNLRPVMIESLEFNRVYEDHGVEINVGDVKKPILLSGVRLKRFSAKPIDARKIELNLQAQVTPKEETVAELSKAFEFGAVKVKITKPKQLDIDDKD